MSDRRKLGYRSVCLFLGTVALLALFGCPLPQSATTPDMERQISQHILDSLRADSLQRCRHHRSFAYQYARSGLQSDAIIQFEKALAFCGADVEVERFYAQYLDQCSKDSVFAYLRDSAFVHYSRAGELDTTHVRTHFWLYRYYHDVGNYPEAIDELLMAARHQDVDSTRILWFKTAADMMGAEGQQERACSLYVYLQTLVPGDPDVAQKMLACVGDDPEERLEALRAACLADTMNRDICRMYAREEEKVGNDQAALIVYLRFAPGDSNVATWESVLRTARRLNSPNVILNAVRQLARLDSTNSDRAAALVEELFRAGRTTEGAQVLMPKVREYPENARLLYLAGDYYSHQSGDDAKRTALQYLDRAVATNDPAWKNQALSLHDDIERPLSDEEINQAQFFGRRIVRLHCCRISGREKQNQLPGLNCP